MKSFFRHILILSPLIAVFLIDVGTYLNGEFIHPSFYENGEKIHHYLSGAILSAITILGFSITVSLTNKLSSKIKGGYLLFVAFLTYIISIWVLSVTENYFMPSFFHLIDDGGYSTYYYSIYSLISRAYLFVTLAYVGIRHYQPSESTIPQPDQTNLVSTGEHKFKLPTWFWGALIAELFFVPSFILLGGFSNQSDNFLLIIAYAPIAWFSPALAVIFRLLPKSLQGVNAMFISSIFCYFILGTAVGGIFDLKKLFRKDVPREISWVWLTAFGILLGMIVASFFSGYALDKETIRDDKSLNPSSLNDCTNLVGTDSEMYESNCLRSLAAKRRDLSICDQIPTLINPDKLAAQASNLSAKEEIISEKYGCYAAVVYETKNLQTCNLIDKNEKYSPDRFQCLSTPCYNLPAGVSRNQCYYNAAVTSGDGFGCVRAGPELVQKCQAEAWKK